MSQDADIRSYQRALERAGFDPRRVAHGLLGIDPDRFLLVVEPWGETGQPPIQFLKSVGDPLRKVTGVMNRTGTEHWRAAWAMPVVPVQDMADWSKTFRARGSRLLVWDTKHRSIVGSGDSMMWNWEFDLIEEGWRDQRDGPLASQTPALANAVREDRTPNSSLRWGSTPL